MAPHRVLSSSCASRKKIVILFFAMQTPPHRIQVHAVFSLLPRTLFPSTALANPSRLVLVCWCCLVVSSWATSSVSMEVSLQTPRRQVSSRDSSIFGNAVTACYYLVQLAAVFVMIIAFFISLLDPSLMINVFAALLLSSVHNIAAFMSVIGIGVTLHQRMPPLLSLLINLTSSVLPSL